LSVEPAPCGTAGAVRRALAALDDRFLLLNGDSFLDANWLDLVPLARATGAMPVMAPCTLSDTSRFGPVEMADDRVTGFAERGRGEAGLINAGVYLLDRRALADFPESGALEKLVLPRLAARGLVRARTYAGYFIDIGVPPALAEAQAELP